MLIPLINQIQIGLFSSSTRLLEFAQDEAYRDLVIRKIRNYIPENAEEFVVINNAAEQILNPVEKISWDDWVRSIGVNSIAPFFLVQGLIEDLTIGCGSIVNITSIHAKLTKPNFTCYAASKAALEAITRSLAIELSPLGISINSVAPAAIETEMLLAGFKDTPEKLEQLKEYHPAKMLGTSDNLASFVKSITDQRAGFLTGAVVDFVVELDQFSMIWKFKSKFKNLKILSKLRNHDFI